MCTDFEVQYYLKWLFLIVNYASCYFELNNLQAEEVVRKVPFAEELLKTGLLLEFVLGGGGRELLLEQCGPTSETY